MHNIFRSSHRRRSLKKADLKGLAKSTGPRIYWSHFLINSLQPWCFPVNLAKCLRISFLHFWATVSIFSETTIGRSSHSQVFNEKAIPKNFAKFPGKHQFWSQSIKNETPAKVFSYEFFETFKNSFFVENLRVAASAIHAFFISNTFVSKARLKLGKKTSKS